MRLTRDQLKQLLARNPQIRCDDQTLAKVSPPLEEPGTPDALDQVVPAQTKSQSRPLVRFIFRRLQLWDVDAVAGGSKDLLDGLQEAGLIPGDRPDQIRFEAFQEQVKTKRQEGTVIELIDF